MKMYKIPVWLGIVKLILAIFIAVYACLIVIENKKLRAQEEIQVQKYLLQDQKMLVKETGRAYWKVMIYEKGEKPIYAECDTLEKVEELKAFYKGD